MNALNIEKEKNSCKTMGIIGLITSFILGILSLPFNIIALVKGSKIKKITGKNETGFILGIAGIILSLIVAFIQVCLITAVLNFTKETKKVFTPINKISVEVLQDNNILSEDIELIDTVVDVYGSPIPHRDAYYIYKDNNGSKIAIYCKTNTITKENITVKIYNDVVVNENSDYIYDDYDDESHGYSDGSTSKTDKYEFGDYKTYTIIKNDKGYSVKQEY